MHALTIFLSSFLLFSIQPIITKQILPFFGGSSGVWLLSLLFFQSLLLGGYFYSHFINHYLSYKNRIRLHIFLLVLSLLSLPVLANAQINLDNQYLKILIVLLISVGFPYFMLSTTTPLIQAFFTLRFPVANVYRLYSLSNAACLLALFSYPLYFERELSILQQAHFWSFLYLFFVIVAVFLLTVSLNKHSSQIQPQKLPLIEAHKKMKWLTYSFLGSALLCAITSHITQNIASVPLLWILPLAIYLIAFIVAFDYPKIFDKRLLEIYLLIFIPFLSLSILWTISSDGISQAQYSAKINVIIYLIGLALSVYYVNGLLVKEKPLPQALTIFYVYLALGGALGSLFVSIISPIIFTSMVEMQILFISLVFLILFEFKNKIFPITFVLLTIFINLAVYLGEHKYTITKERGFYGALKVNEIKDSNSGQTTRILIHGSIIHGFQIINSSNSFTPTSYYHEKSGFGQLVKSMKANKNKLNIGMIGMGVGTISSYNRDTDFIRFFEIDPLIVKFATENFTYISKANGLVDYKIGDGRLLVEKEDNNFYDILAIDAFTGDAIPIHLLTDDAVKIYLNKLKPDGALAFHISSNYLDLKIPLVNIAKNNNLHYQLIKTTSSENLQTPSEWLILSPQPLTQFNNVVEVQHSKHKLWTDNYSNLLTILKQ